VSPVDPPVEPPLVPVDPPVEPPLVPVDPPVEPPLVPVDPPVLPVEPTEPVVVVVAVEPELLTVPEPVPLGDASALELPTIARPMTW
jgi:hypothetical protein